MATPTVAQDGDGVGLDSLKGDAQKHAEDAKNHAISFLHRSSYFLYEMPLRNSSKLECTFCHLSINQKISDNWITASGQKI